MMNHKQAQGFTLIELLVAFSVLLFGMAGIISMFSAGLSLERASSLAVDSTAVLDELIPEVKRRLSARLRESEAGEQGGDLNIVREQVPGRPTLDFSVESMPIPDDPSGFGYLVRIQIYAKGAPDDQGYSFDYLPLRLAPSFEALVEASPTTLNETPDKR